MSARWISPLRYPGGKARMTEWLVDVFDHLYMPMDVEVWIEPFGGGAGAGLTALEQGTVEDVWICEANPALAAFWTTLTDEDGEGERLARRVESTVPDLVQFTAARETVAAGLAGEQVDRFELGFAAFLLNRCSRSGMVLPNVGPIGGKAQAGKDTIASRFHGPRLAERLRRVAGYGRSFRVHEGDALDYIEELDGVGFEEECFLFVDPPYIEEGNRLYAQGMDAAAHCRLAELLLSHPTPWVLTYDAHPVVLDLYPECPVYEFDIPHTANRQSVGTEYLVTGPNVWLPAGNPLGKGAWRQVAGPEARQDPSGWILMDSEGPEGPREKQLALW